VIRLSFRAVTEYGNHVIEALRKSGPELRCDCRQDEVCLVEVSELPGRRFEAIVTMPRPVMEPKDWTVCAAVTGMYRRLFDNRATAERIHEEVAAMVGAAMQEERARTPLPEDLNIVLVDSSMLDKAQHLIVGCENCTRVAEIPFKCILDSLTDGDPTVTQYILVEGSTRCPRCGRSLNEDTLVEFQPPCEIDN
jgi:hypothetical protein